MPTIPKIVTLTNSSVDILNAIRNGATQNYREYVPFAQNTADANNIREIGAIIMDHPNLQNEFLSALVNRIGRVMITSKMYTNPFKMFKKGLMEFGETVEEIFVNIAKPFQFDPQGSENTVFKREIPDVKSAFHVMNYQKYYKTTIQNDMLRQAFLSWQGITDLIAKIVDSMYTGAEYDEFQVFKYMLAKHILRGQLYPVTIPAVSTVNMKDIVSEIKAISNDMEFMKDKYNLAGVKTHTLKDDQYIIVNTKFDAKMDVEVLASAFNMSKAEFIGHRVLVDSFGAIDNDRLAILFEDDDTYVALTSEQLTALDSIPACLLDINWWMVFTNYQNFTEQYNGEGLYWNYWYHLWQTFSVSPFANNAIFIPGTPTVTSVTCTPATVSLAPGSVQQFDAVVVVTNFAPQTVEWSINSELSTIDSRGKLTIGADETAETITVTCTSKFDGTKSDTSTVTVL